MHLGHRMREPYTNLRRDLGSLRFLTNQDCVSTVGEWDIITPLGFPYTTKKVTADIIFYSRGS